MKVPHHIAFIMDGNRRWAKQNLLSIPFGHKKGVDVMKELVLHCADRGVRVVTAYAFSTENWNRPRWEVNALIELIENFLINNCQEMVEKGICFNTIGDVSAFSDRTQKIISEVKEATAQSNRIDLVLALNYGSRNEICRAVKRVMEAGIGIEELDEGEFSKFLDTAHWPDPDLLVRTSGEQRLSNYLLWQLSYTEMYITKTFWPDFSTDEIDRAIEDYKNRQRRWGK